MSTRSRVTDLASRFESTPPPEPTRERFTSAVDKPKAVVSAEGRAASRRSAAKAEALASGAAAHARRRRVPAILPGDDDLMRSLKRAAQAREAEIQDIAARMSALIERLARVTSQLDAASSAPVVTGGKPSDKRLQSGEFASVASRVPRKQSSVPSSAPRKDISLQSILAAARSPRTRANNTPASAPPPSTAAGAAAGAGAGGNTNNNSLEAILAAARGGASSGGAKYSKMMRNLK